MAGRSSLPHGCAVKAGVAGADTRSEVVEVVVQHANGACGREGPPGGQSLPGSLARVVVAVAMLALLGRPAGTAAQPLPSEAAKKLNFPAVLTGGGAMNGGHPLVADLGLDNGFLSIAFGTLNGKLYVVRYNGAVAPGWPKTLPSDIVSSPAVGDLDHDGNPDLVVGYGSLFQFAKPGGIRAYKRDGTLLWERTTGDVAEGPNGFSDPVVGTPAVGDVDGDGLPEVAVGAIDMNVYLLRGADGSNMPGWPRNVRDTVFSSPALHDIDGDGRLDVVIGSDAHQEGPPFNTPTGGCLHVFRWDGREPPGWPRCVDQVVAGSPVVGDIDGDGQPEIVVGLGAFFSGAQRRLLAFETNGMPVAGWPVALEGDSSGSPALADITGDGVLDVIVTTNRPPPDPSPLFTLVAFEGDGSQIFRAVPHDYFGTNLSAGDPIVADVTGDSNVEILVPTNGEIAVFSRTGQQLTDDGSHRPGAFWYPTDFSLHNATVAQMEPGSGGLIEVIAVTGSPFPTATDAKVWVWNPKIAQDPPWGMFRQNGHRTGVAPGTADGIDLSGPLEMMPLTPCRVLDTRNPDGPYGGPIFQGQTARTYNLHGKCGIPSDAVAVAANVTAVHPSNPGNLRLYPGSGRAPDTSVLNFKRDQVRANNVIVALGAGEITIQNDVWNVTTHILLDVSGYFRRPVTN